MTKIERIKLAQAETLMAALKALDQKDDTVKEFKKINIKKFVDKYRKNK